MYGKELARDCCNLIDRWLAGEKTDKYQDMMDLDRKYPNIGFSREAYFLKRDLENIGKKSEPNPMVHAVKSVFGADCQVVSDTYEDDECPF